MHQRKTRNREREMENSRLEQEFLQSPRVYRFGEFVLDVERYELSKAGVAIRLQPKTFDVLRYLVTHPGRLIDKDELLRAVWPDVIVTENSLTRSIADLRKALDDDAAAPRYIETVARRGYRLLVTPQAIDAVVPAADVQPRPRPAAQAAPALVPSATLKPRPRRTFIVFGVIAAVIAIVIIVAAITNFGWRGTGPQPAAGKPAIAVLPFANLSSEPDTQYFADGVAEDLLDLFARMPGLKVVARTSSFAFRAQERDIKAIGRDLGVEWVLEGSVRREAGKVRVTVQLIDARTGYHAWSDRYERQYTDLFAMQDEIARAVVAQVVPHVKPGMLIAIAPPTANFDAYQSFMIGRDYLNRRSPDWRKKALVAFDRAIELDPEFARAHAGKAIVAAMFAGGADAPGPALARARESADRALQLDPKLALGFAARGFALMSEGSDLRGAETAFRRALELDPTHGNVYNWLSNVLSLQHRREEASQQNKKGIEADPLNPILLENRARRLFFQGRFDEARAGYLKLLQLPAAGDVKYRGLVELHMARGELAEALRYVRLRARETNALDQAAIFRPGFIAYARLGMLDEAERRFKATTAAPFAVGWLSSIEWYLRIVGRLHELAPLARPHIKAAPMAPWLEKTLGRAAALHGDWELGIARLAPLFRQESTIGLGGWGGDIPELDSHLALIHALIKNGRIDAGQAEIRRLLGLHRTAQAEGLTKTPDETYHYAMALALASPARDAEVFAALDDALALGWNNYRLAEHDPRWERHKSDPRFKAAMTKAAESVARERAKVEARMAAGDSDFVDAKP